MTTQGLGKGSQGLGAGAGGTGNLEARCGDNWMWTGPSFRWGWEGHSKGSRSVDAPPSDQGGGEDRGASPGGRGRSRRWRGSLRSPDGGSWGNVTAREELTGGRSVPRGGDHREEVPRTGSI